MKFKAFLLETFLPRFCLGCSKEGSYICEDCAIFISEAIPFCPVCKKNSYLGARHKGCRGELDGLTLLWDKQGIIAKAIKEIEENGVFSIIDELMEFFIFMLENDSKRFKSLLNLLLDEKTVIVYIPSDRKIGFDFSKMLAQKMALISDRKIAEKGEQVLLIQPVYSDSQEMKSWAKRLKEEGANRVWGFSLALDLT